MCWSGGAIWSSAPRQRRHPPQVIGPVGAVVAVRRAVRGERDRKQFGQGVKQPKTASLKLETPAIGDHQARTAGCANSPRARRCSGVHIFGRPVWRPSYSPASPSLFQCCRHCSTLFKWTINSSAVCRTSAPDSTAKFSALAFASADVEGKSPFSAAFAVSLSTVLAASSFSSRYLSDRL